MKELDVLLERFAARALDRLDDAGLDALERLLAQPDQDVHAWLVSEPGSSAPPEMAGIVALVRACAVEGGKSGAAAHGVRSPSRRHAP